MLKPRYWQSKTLFRPVKSIQVTKANGIRKIFEKGMANNQLLKLIYDPYSKVKRECEVSQMTIPLQQWTVLPVKPMVGNVDP